MRPRKRLRSAAVLSTRGGGDEAPQAQAVDVKPNSVAVIDPKTNRVVAGIPVGNGPTRIAVAGGKVWVLNRDDQTIGLIDASSKALEKNIWCWNAAGRPRCRRAERLGRDHRQATPHRR